MRVKLVIGDNLAGTIDLPNGQNRFTLTFWERVTILGLEGARIPGIFKEPMLLIFQKSDKKDKDGLRIYELCQIKQGARSRGRVADGSRKNRDNENGS